MTAENIPKATAKRLPIYYRYLNILHDTGKQRISSTELAEAVQVDSAPFAETFHILVRWANGVMVMMLIAY